MGPCLRAVRAADCLKLGFADLSNVELHYVALLILLVLQLDAGLMRSFAAVCSFAAMTPTHHLASN